MTLLVDTSVWSLAFRRDTPVESPEVIELRRALGGNDIVVTTGLILQELLQGFVPDRARQQILEREHPDLAVRDLILGRRVENAPASRIIARRQVVRMIFPAWAPLSIRRWASAARSNG